MRGKEKKGTKISVTPLSGTLVPHQNAKRKKESSYDRNNRYKSLLISDCICIFFSFFGITKKAAGKKPALKKKKSCKLQNSP